MPEISEDNCHADDRILEEGPIVEGDRIIRDPECERITGISRTTRWRLGRLGKFPRRIPLSANASGYLLSEVLAWLEARKRDRDLSKLSILLAILIVLPFFLEVKPVSAREVTNALGGKWVGSYGMCSCPLPGHGKGRGDKNPSLKISNGPVGMCVHCFGGCDWRDIRDELQRRGLLPVTDRNHQRLDGGVQRHQDRDRRQVPDSNERKRIEQNIARARATWKAALPVLKTVRGHTALYQLIP